MTYRLVHKDRLLPGLLRNVAFITVVLVGLNLAWRTVRYALAFPMWGDEAFVVTSLYTRDFAGMVKPLEYWQIVPLGFMWAELAVVRLAGLSEYAVRLVPYLTGVASMLLFWRFAARSLGRWSALLAVAVFAASYYPVRHAAEVKPYAGDLLVSLLLTVLAWTVMTRPKSALRSLALTAFAGVSVWLSYPAVFVAGAAGLCLLVKALRSRDRPRIAAAAVYGAVLCCSFAAMYVIYGRPHAEAAEFLKDIPTWHQAWPPISRPWLLPWWFLDVHAGNLMAYPVGGKNFGSTGTFLLVIVGSVALWRSRRRDLLALLLGPLVLMFLAAALRLYPYGTSARVALHMAPAFCLLSGLGLGSVLKVLVRRQHVPAAFRIPACALAVVAVLGAAIDIREPYKKISSLLNRQAVRDLAGQTRPGDLWVFYNALTEVPYAPNLVSYKGSAASLRYYVRRYAPVPVRWGPPADQVEAQPGGRVLLLAYHDNKVPFPQELYDQYHQALASRLGPARKLRTYVLTSPKDPKREQLEQIEAYEFPVRP
jgi:4-amino-4-deoxy-L-arabinose transferase-like glycosyltransferase